MLANVMLDVSALEPGSTGFMILAASLVMLMTPGIGILLWWFSHQAKHSRNYDPEFCFTGMDHRIVDHLWLLLMLQRRRRRHYRQPRQSFPAWSYSRFHVHQWKDTRVCLHSLPDDVCHHHTCPYYRRIRESCKLQSLHDIPYRMADTGLLSLRPHDMGRRIIS